MSFTEHDELELLYHERLFPVPGGSNQFKTRWWKKGTVKSRFE
jgi:hypothetical protein